MEDRSRSAHQESAGDAGGATDVSAMNVALVPAPVPVPEPTTQRHSARKSTARKSAARQITVRKSSAHLTLIFISAAAAAGLAGCGRLESESATSRDVYANIEECRADWGNPGDCEEIDEKRSATGNRSFYGPRYSSRTGNYNSGYSSTTRPGSRSKGTVSSTPTRGGFGSSSSRHGGSSHSSSG
jgi:uncharacterized protein YgiB involved in biofilm formation